MSQEVTEIDKQVKCLIWISASIERGTAHNIAGHVVLGLDGSPDFTFIQLSEEVGKCFDLWV